MRSLKLIATALMLTTIGVIPALAQGRLDRPSFFQDGQVLIEQEIEKLQLQQQQSSSEAVEHPSQLLTINDEQLHWQKLIFQNAGFSVWMPEGVQSQETVVLETGAGQLSFEVLATHPQSGRFVAAYSNMIAPFQATNPAILLDAVRDALIAKTNFKLTNEEAISLNQFPGKQLSLQDREETIIFRVYLIEQRVYVLAASQKEAENLSQEVDSFF